MNKARYWRKRDVNKAIEIANRAHAGQVDKAGVPYNSSSDESDDDTGE